MNIAFFLLFFIIASLIFRRITSKSSSEMKHKLTRLKVEIKPLHWNLLPVKYHPSAYEDTVTLISFLCFVITIERELRLKKQK